MKHVLIPLAINGSDFAAMHFARQTYINKMVLRGVMPVFVSTAETENMWNEKFLSCEGVLLMGGNDISSALYGEEAHVETKAIEPTRDTMELYFARKSLLERKPLLGICRGCQMLSIASGGRLYQHVPEVLAAFGDSAEQHGIGKDKGYADLRTNVKHDVLIDSGSRICSILNSDRVTVNTGHHQSIESCGEQLLIVGRSPQGIVEIIEHRDLDFFCFGIQSHPEAEESSVFDKLFDLFAQQG